MPTRRQFLVHASLASLAPLVPLSSWSLDAPATKPLPASTAAVRLRTRLNWPEFRESPMYQPYVAAVDQLKQNSSAQDPHGWPYWVRAHIAKCPHHEDYFLSWHRGLLLQYEALISQITKLPDFALPYWDYNADRNVPAEYLVAGTPLHDPNRIDNDGKPVTAIPPDDIFTDAFGDNCMRFQRGADSDISVVFEETLENGLHDNVHDGLGRDMMRPAFSPTDPLFWLHHCNLDRLWAAWVATGGKRSMPPATDPYWAGNNEYVDQTMPRVRTISTQGLGYTYANLTLPPVVPEAPPLPPAAIRTVSQAPHGGNHVESLNPPAAISLGGAAMSLAVPLASTQASKVRAMAVSGGHEAFSAVTVVLRGVQFTDLGRDTGFGYRVYLNLPIIAAPGKSEEDYLIGTISSFGLRVLQEHQTMGHGAGSANGVELRFPATRAIQRLGPGVATKLVVTFVPTGDAATAKSDLVTVHDFHVEASDNSQ